MKTVIDLRIAPTERAAVTPCELLEDFADITPSWQFLEEESGHYASLKGVPACVLRQILYQPYQVLDFAFSACEAHEQSCVRLVLVDAEHPPAGARFEDRDDVVARFVAAFGAYLDRRDRHAEIHVVEEDLASTAA